MSIAHIYRAELTDGGSQDFKVIFPEFTEAFEDAAKATIDAMTGGKAAAIFVTDEPVRESASASFTVTAR